MMNQDSQTTAEPKNDDTSIVIITKNSEKTIGRCLESVQWTDEIIMLDSGSTDNTLTIAKKYHCNIYYQSWLGFGPQKNKAISYATSTWILALDADEIVSDELKSSIQHAIRNGDDHVYQFKRLSQFCGRWIHHGDWGRDIIIRLFKRGHARYSNDAIHECIISDHAPKMITGTLLHYSQDSIHASLDKLNCYSDATSKMLYQQNKKVGLLKATIHKHWTFFRSFFLRLGFLDGAYGYLIAKLSAYGTYFKYVKLWEQQQNDRS